MNPVGLFGAFLALFAVLSPARAETYPSRLLTLIVPFPAGGVTDVLGRLVAGQLSARLGKTVVVENRPGAGGNIGMAAAAKAPADGYTLFLGTMGTNAINPGLYKNMNVKPEKEFTPLAMVATLPNVLVVNPEKYRATSVRAFLDEANAGATLLYGSFGNGSSSHLCGALLATGVGRTFLHVPFRGSGDAVIALLRGDTDFMFDSIPTALPQVRAGKLRPLAVSSAKHSTVMPNVPTMQEAGVAGFDMNVWFGIFTNAATPKPIADRMAAELEAIVAQPDLQQRLRELGADPFQLPRDHLEAFIAADAAKWARIVADHNITID